MKKPNPYKVFSVTIDRTCSEEIVVKARDPIEAKKKAWDKFSNRKPKKNDHQIYCDEV